MTIALVGPTGGGKSTIADALAKRLGGSRVSFADPLRRIATQVGWKAEKKNDPEQRKLIQDVSADWKSRYGEGIFATKLLDAIRGDVAGYGVPVIDDLRHSIELSTLVTEFNFALIVCIEEPEAETHWSNCFSAYMRGDSQCAWAGHRSELEWRGFRDLIPDHILNNKQIPTGVDDAVNSILSLYSSTIRRI
jgi:ABC-type oligopeptide transport system ATPase subunit